MVKIRSWLLSHLPAGLVAQPPEWFLATLCFLSGLVIVAGLGETNSVGKLLWRPVYMGWGISLVLGSIALMSGLSSIQWARGTDIYTMKRVPAYKLGLRLLGLSSLAYAVAILVVVGWAGVVAAAITLAFAATCFIRLLTLGREK